MSASLTLGSLRLTGNDESGARFEVLGEDVEFGSPQPVEVSIASLMVDGSVTETSRYENREASFRVEVSGANSAVVAKAAAELELEVGKRSSLTWVPGDGFSPPTVFDVETSSVAWLFNDLDELGSTFRRTFRLRLVCLPFARSVEPTIVGSEFVSESVAVLDDCESTTGWSGASGYTGAFTVDSTAGNFVTGTGSVKMISTPYSGASNGGLSTATTRVRKALSIDASAGGYLVMSVRTDWGNHFGYDPIRDAVITTSGGGAVEVPTLVASRVSNGFTRYSWPVPHNSTVTAIEFEVSQSRAAPAGSSPDNPAIRFDSIGLASDSTSGQAARSFVVGGSARSEASLSISAPAGLGDVLLYTCPDVGDGFRPDLRRWVSGGTGGTDAGAINGTYTNIGSTGAVFNVPASMFRPGSYSLMAHLRLSSGGSGPLTVNAVLMVDGVTVGPTESIVSQWFSPPDQTNYYVMNLGSMPLPPVAVDLASTAVVRFTVYGPSNVRLDELLAFPQREAALTWVSCGYGSPGGAVSSRVWVDAPSPVNPRPAVLVGNNAGRMDARGVVPKSRGRHVLQPGKMLVYLLSGASGGASFSASYYKRWMHNAAEVN